MIGTKTMINTIKKTLTNTVAAALLLGLALPASANDNSRYGTTVWKDLPLRGMVSKNVWVGSWWSYRNNGIAYRHRATGDMKNGYQKPEGWTSTETPEHLSAAEKYDLLVGRGDLIEREKIRGYLERIGETETDITTKIDRRRELIRLLNEAIKKNREDSDFDWKTSDDGVEYLKINTEIEEAEAGLDADKPTIDTATEYEIWNHGTAQYGVQQWWGHCNAWAAAAILEPEPRHSSEVDGITFTAGDVKALITETWMELNSSFFGSRNDFHGSEDARKKINYNDVTPGGFHIFFSDQIANHDKSFVIDRYTGDQVWNQPVKAFRSKIEVMNDGEPKSVDVKITKYSSWGEPEVKSLGEQEVYEVGVTTTIHWITDGVPHETLTVENISDDIDDETFSSTFKIGNLYDHQVEIRTIFYTLWLDKHPDDPDAEIIGDGEWQHGNGSNYTDRHPDFLWQPLANVNTSRDYENEYVEYDTVVNRILPGSITKAEDPEEPVTGGFSATGPVEIPDAETDRGASLELVIEGGPEKIGAMTVKVLVNHTYSGDLRLVLTSPEGGEFELKEFGSGGADDNVDRTYDVKEFDGGVANGTWTLTAYDQWEEDTGTIESLELNFK
ncbi:MAG: hypothetical protein ACI9OJ_004661 [Myxococcota bacterium]|jgi:hypothetical protein